MLIEYDGELVYYTTPQLTPEDIKDIQPANTHPHLCLLKLWVKDCEATSAPHTKWMFKGDGCTKWVKCNAKTPMFVPGWEYKRIEPNVVVNDEEVPLGIETHDEFNKMFQSNKKCSIWVPDVTTSALISCLSGEIILDYAELEHLISKRLMYTTKSDAIKRAKAMIKWSDIVGAILYD